MRFKIWWNFGAKYDQSEVLPLKTIFALIGCLLKGSYDVGIMIGPPFKAFNGGPIRIPHESISPNHNESLVY
jgi:hypothetical protein